ncbi:MAG: hypothetical protein IJ991_12640 [Thermoguttaceae bacterium]|nr:hypothetical protein [Thermoguttaceae bacterium]
MSKFSRRRRLFASLGNLALLSALGASFVCLAGCAGGSNPFCCDSKEKNQIDQNLERAQSLDEREKDAKATEESDAGTSEETGEQEKSEKKTTFANILTTDGSGDAAQIAAATPASTPPTFAREPQEVPVTASTSADARETPASNAEPTGLVQAPVLPSAASTAQVAPAALPDAASTSETSPQVPNATPEKTAAPETPTQTNDSAPDDATNASQDAQNKQEAQEAQDAQKTPETRQENADETPQSSARSTRRNGPQRAATRQVAQRGSRQPVAVPQTRAAATLSAPAPLVTFRTRVVVPAVDAPRETSLATFRTQVAVPAVDAPRETPLATFRTRVVVP